MLFHMIGDVDDIESRYKYHEQECVGYRCEHESAADIVADTFDSFDVRKECVWISWAAQLCKIGNNHLIIPLSIWSTLCCVSIEEVLKFADLDLFEFNSLPNLYSGTSDVVRFLLKFDEQVDVQQYHCNRRQPHQQCREAVSHPFEYDYLV